MKKYFSFDKNFNLYHISSPKKKVIKNNNFSLAKNLNLGYYLVTPIVLGIFLGLFLDKLLKTGKIFFTILFTFGIVGTFYNLFKIYADERKNN